METQDGKRPAGRCHCTQLRKASRNISQLFDLALAPSGLKTTQRAVLAEISRTEPTTVKRLASALVMDAGGLTHTLKPLIRDRLVVIRVDPEDRRNRLIGLTAKGLKQLQQSDELWKTAQRGFEAAFGVKDAEALRTTLARLIDPGFADAFKKLALHEAYG